MARYCSGMTAAGAGAALRPPLGLLSTATVTPVLREVAMFNTSAVACTYRLVHFTGGTAGAAQVESRDRANAPPAVATAFGLWTADITVVEDTGWRVRLGAADASATILTFGAAGIEGRLGATAGLAMVAVGTGQICEVYYSWDE